jgi:hypothetical protein
MQPKGFFVEERPTSPAPKNAAEAAGGGHCR